MERNAVVFGINPQNDFGHPKGSLYCPGGFKVVGGGMILVWYGEEKGWLIGFSADCHPKNSEHFKEWPPHCIVRTWGAKFLAGIQVPYRKSSIFLKGTKIHEDGYDPFEGKDECGRNPEQFMGNPANTTVVVWGIAINYCVRAFVLTARKKGYKVYVALDACAAVPTPGNPPEDFVTEEQAIQNMKAAGAIMTTVEEVVCGKI